MPKDIEFCLREPVGKGDPCREICADIARNFIETKSMEKAAELVGFSVERTQSFLQMIVANEQEKLNDIIRELIAEREE